jgi:hypothetical protein
MSSSEKIPFTKTVADQVEKLGGVVQSAFHKALVAQLPLADANVERLRRVNPKARPAQLISRVNKIYLSTVTATGAGAGAAAIVPNGPIQATAAVADLLTFLEASVFYALTVAKIHNLPMDDVEKRQLLVMSVLLGDNLAKSVVEPLVGRTGNYWGKKIVQSIPAITIKKINKVLGTNFITKYGTKQGILVLGKQVPMFIGMGIGAAGNHLFGRAIVSATAKILGPAPKSWPKVETTNAAVVSEGAPKVIAVKKPVTKKPVAKKA